MTGSAIRPAAALVLAAILVASLAGGTETEERVLRYVGLAQCKMCHQSDTYGDQYNIWRKGPHARAYDTLSGFKSLAKAAELGIEDPQADARCLRCHVTAWEAPDSLKTAVVHADGVTCEACHGPGSLYYRPAVKRGVCEGKIEPQSVGLILSDEGVCRHCHNEDNPFHEAFDYEKYKGRICHPLPKDED
jgi:hypothetical protein